MTGTNPDTDLGMEPVAAVPPPRRPPSLRERRLDACRQSPGQWFRWRATSRNSASVQAAHIMDPGRTPSKVRGVEHPGEFEAVTRLIDGQPWLYVRYVGDELVWTPDVETWATRPTE